MKRVLVAENRAADYIKRDSLVLPYYTPGWRMKVDGI